MKLIKPNSTTWFALAHPVLWSVLAALFVVLLGLIVFEDWRAGLSGGTLMLRSTPSSGVLPVRHDAGPSGSATSNRGPSCLRLRLVCECDESLG